MTRLRSSHNKCLSALVRAVLASVLLAAQAMAYAHGLDVDGHAAGEVCEVCITIGGLGGTASANVQPLALARAPDDLPAYAAQPPRGGHRAHRLARGPPAPS